MIQALRPDLPATDRAVLEFPRDDPDEFDTARKIVWLIERLTPGKEQQCAWEIATTVLRSRGSIA